MCLLLVIFSLIIYEYKIIYDIGFIYSICTVGGIILCNNYINHDNKLISSFRLSLVAFIFSLPISLSSFYEVNLLSIIYNMIFVPYVSIIVYPLSLISFIIPSLSFIFSLSIKLLEVCSSYLSTIRFFSIYLDFNMVEIIIYYIVTIFMFYKNEYKLSILLILIVIIDIMIPYLDSNYYVYYFDVGQGDSSLIISPYRKDIILIDTGGIYGRNVSDNYLNYMKSEGITRIDYMILSHGDFDHMGDASYVIDNIDVDNVIFNCGPYNDLEKELIKVLDKKHIKYYSCIDELNIYDNKLYFINDNIYDNENDNSSVIYSSFYGRSLLFMGDAGRVVEKDIIDRNRLGFDDCSFKGEEYHGQKRKRKISHE